MNATKCAGVTQAGNPCSRNATDGDYCTTHASQAPTQPAAMGGIGNPDTHITINAIVSYIFGGLTLVFMFLGGLFLAVGASVLAEFMAQYYEPVATFLEEGGALIGIMTMFLGLVIGLPQIFAGVGLSKRQEYGRIMALVLAAIHILWGLTLFSGNVMAILNLAYGGYAYWSLLHPTVVAKFHEAAAA